MKPDKPSAQFNKWFRQNFRHMAHARVRAIEARVKLDALRLKVVQAEWELREAEKAEADYHAALTGWNAGLAAAKSSK